MVAPDLGYASPAAFIMRFSRLAGFPPSRDRR
jgi:AraC-like DNA-binding protein